jgi:hypothetical protein
VVIGISAGGRPNTLLGFQNLAEAKEDLIGGDLLDGVAAAFNGSADFVPQKVFGFRVNAGTQSAIVLKSGASDVLQAKSAIYGINANQIRVMVQNGAAAGSKKITVSYQGNEVVKDNIARKSFSVGYTGSSATAVTMEITNTGISFVATGDASANLDLTWDDYDTLEGLVSRINDTGVFAATLLDVTPGAGTRQLDTMTAASIIGSAVTSYSNLDEFAKTLANMQYIGEVSLVASGIIAVPDNTAGFQYFSGAVGGTSTIGDWAASLEKLEDEDVQMVATPSTNQSVHVLIVNHCIGMSQTDKRKERQCVLGGPADIPLDVALGNAAEFNSEFASYVIDSAVASNPVTGQREAISPALVACKIAGMEAAAGISTPLTNKAVKVSAFGAKRRASEVEKMIKGGIMPCGINEEGALVVVRAVTTYQGENLGLNERFCVREALYMDRDLRKAYARRIGTSAEPSQAEILSILINKARGWYVQGLINKSDKGEFVFDVSIRFDGDKTYLVYGKFVRTPNNFIFITSNNMIYSSEAAA